ncbi:MAG: hypothetical protein CVT48_05670 [Thermoplasmata archaeon HGW-Thermoplasmata-1]|nr:MAG: hypothetical protein CVT48_05670 [Thermoplasmata archaeon HGW-Thermoplasmata-1]
MKKRITIGGILAVLVVLFFIFAGLDGLFITKTVNEVNNADKDKTYRIKGEVTSVSAATNTFTVKDDGGNSIIIKQGDTKMPDKGDTVAVTLYKNGLNDYTAKWVWKCLIFK